MMESKRKHRLHSAAMLLGPLSFVLAIALLQKYIGFKASAAAGTTLWMALWWILRPVHIAVTALIPIVVNALLDLVPMSHVIQQYFSEIIVLLFGADLICLTWSTTGLDKRLALKTLCCIGPSMRQQISVWLLSSTVLSIFLPNVVVCTIMVPVAVSMLHFIGEENIKTSTIAPPIFLAIVWGAGIGGFGSPLGGAANLVVINYLEKLTGQEFMYINWITRFLPFLFLVVLLNWLYLLHLPAPVKQLNGTKQYFQEMYDQLGGMRFGEKISLTLFVTATLLAFLRPLFVAWLPALKPAYVFFTIGFLAFSFKAEDGKPLLTWEFAENGVMWGMPVSYTHLQHAAERCDLLAQRFRLRFESAGRTRQRLLVEARRITQRLRRPIADLSDSDIVVVLRRAHEKADLIQLIRQRGPIDLPLHDQRRQCPHAQLFHETALAARRTVALEVFVRPNTALRSVNRGQHRRRHAAEIQHRSSHKAARTRRALRRLHELPGKIARETVDRRVCHSGLQSDRRLIDALSVETAESLGHNRLRPHRLLADQRLRAADLVKRDAAARKRPADAARLRFHLDPIVQAAFYAYVPNHQRQPRRLLKQRQHRGQPDRIFLQISLVAVAMSTARMPCHRKLRRLIRQTQLHFLTPFSFFTAGICGIKHLNFPSPRRTPA